MVEGNREKRCKRGNSALISRQWASKHTPEEAAAVVLNLWFHLCVVSWLASIILSYKKSFSSSLHLSPSKIFSISYNAAPVKHLPIALVDRWPKPGDHVSCFPGVCLRHLPSYISRGQPEGRGSPRDLLYFVFEVGISSFSQRVSNFLEFGGKSLNGSNTASV
jgi:hypothetical protein